MVPEIFRTLIAAYLIATLSATALAKIRNYRVASIGIQRERIIPAKAALALTFSLAITEFTLATLLMTGTAPEVVSLSAAALFTVFAGYRTMVAIKTKSLTCACAGSIRTDPASAPSVAGAGTAVLIMAALSCALIFLGPPASYPISSLAVFAWITPVFACIVGAVRRRGLREVDASSQLSAEFVPLWTAEMKTRW